MGANGVREKGKEQIRRNVEVELCSESSQIWFNGAQNRPLWKG